MHLPPLLLPPLLLPPLLLPLLLFSSPALSHSTPPTPPTTVATTNNLTIIPLFTVDVRVGKSLKPIRIRGGEALLLLPIEGGRAYGPALNGTIKSGLVRASYFRNRTVEFPNNVAYGTTEDGESFVIEQKGAGRAGEQAARLTIDIGGKYAYLRDRFILTRNVDDIEHLKVRVEGFSVS